MADRLGTQVGNYRLTHLLGQGGFAQVYLGVQIHLGTQAAVKLLHAPLASAGEVEKFRQEARTLATLIHPHIVRVLDFGVEAGLPYLVLDYAPGGSLRERHPSGTKVPLPTVIASVQQIAQGLQYAHDQRLIHRDIKPQNLLLGRNGEILLSDFGISVVAESTSRTLAQGFAGTVAYSAPEQLQEHPRPASDQYALGVVVYEWLTGKLPFTGAFQEVIAKHLFAAPPPLCDQLPSLPPAVEQVVFTALAKDPKERFASVSAFATALAQASQSAVAVSPPSPSLLPPEMEETVRGQEGTPPASALGTPGFITTSTSDHSSQDVLASLESPLPFGVRSLDPGSQAPSNSSNPDAPSGLPLGKPQSQRGLWIALALLAVVLVVGGVAYYLTNQDSPTKAAQARCVDVKNGDWSDFYSHSTPDLQGQFGPEEQFVASQTIYVDNHGGVMNCTIATLNQNGSTATGTAVITYGDGSQDTIDFQEVLENGGWELSQDVRRGG